MEVGVVAGAYDSMIRGFSIDVLNPEAKVGSTKTTRSYDGMNLLKLL